MPLSSTQNLYSRPDWQLSKLGIVHTQWIWVWHGGYGCGMGVAYYTTLYTTHESQWILGKVTVRGILAEWSHSNVLLLNRHRLWLIVVIKTKKYPFSNSRTFFLRNWGYSDTQYTNQVPWTRQYCRKGGKRRAQYGPGATGQKERQWYKRTVDSVAMGTGGEQWEWVWRAGTEMDYGTDDTHKMIGSMIMNPGDREKRNTVRRLLTGHRDMYMTDTF